MEPRRIFTPDNLMY